jgi:hypothetical protein
VMLLGISSTDSLTGLLAFFGSPLLIAVVAAVAPALLTKLMPKEVLQREEDHAPPAESPAQGQTLNLRRGLLRVWVVLFVLWCVFVAVADHVPTKIAYAWNYDPSVKWERNPYMKIVLQMQQGEAAQTSRAALPLSDAEASGVNDDRAAQNAQLAKRYKVPPKVADRFPEEFRQRALTENTANALAEAPRLREAVATGFDATRAAENSKLATQYGIPADAVAQFPEDLRQDALTGRGRDGKPANAVILSMLVDQQVETLGWSRVARPDWNWLVDMLVPPTLGVAAVACLLWGLSEIVRWVWRGFRSVSQ